MKIDVDEDGSKNPADKPVKKTADTPANDSQKDFSKDTDEKAKNHDNLSKSPKQTTIRTIVLVILHSLTHQTTGIKTPKSTKNLRNKKKIPSPNQPLSQFQLRSKKPPKPPSTNPLASYLVKKSKNQRLSLPLPPINQIRVPRFALERILLPNYPNRPSPPRFFAVSAQLLSLL